MKAYSMDLRERVLQDCDGGLEVRQVAVKYRVSESWIWRQRRRETGEVAPRKAGPKRPPPWRAYADVLARGVREQPDVTLQELRRRLSLPLSVATVCRALQALQLTLKKSSESGGTRSTGCRRATHPLAGRDARTGPLASGVH